MLKVAEIQKQNAILEKQINKQEVLIPQIHPSKNNRKCNADLGYGEGSPKGNIHVQHLIPSLQRESKE